MKTKIKLSQQQIQRGIVLSLMLFLFKIGMAQDVILLRTGEEISAKVTEINETQVKFKMPDNLNGPLHVLSKSEVFSVKYENGMTETFKNPDQERSNEQITTNTVYMPVKAGTPSKFDNDTSDFAKKRRKNFSGPRIGITYIAEGTTASYLEEKGKNPFLMQFGWQFEARLFTVEDGTSGIVEFFPLIGGIEQGMFLPSASFLIGLRGGTDKSWEFAMGPTFGIKADQNGNLKGAVGMVIALGTSFKKGNIWFPVNLAFVPSVGTVGTQYNETTNTYGPEQKFQSGWRISLLIGFNSRTK